MRTEEFEITLEGKGKLQSGRLQLQVDAAGVSGCIVAADRESFFRGKALRKDRYILSVRLQLEAWTEECDALLVVREDDTLTGVLLSAWQIWTLTGTRLALSPVSR